MAQSPEDASPYGRKGYEAVRRIRGLIETGKLVPGDHIRQDEIAYQLGLTRVPVREALKALTMEGLVEHHRNRGHFVTQHDDHELAQIVWLRDICENRLAQTIEWPPVEKIGKFVALNQKCWDAFSEGDISAWISADEDFHRALWALSPLRLVQRQAERMWSLLAPWARHLDFSISRARKSYEYHLGIIKALENQNLELLCKCVQAHHEYLQEEAENPPHLL